MSEAPTDTWTATFLQLSHSGTKQHNSNLRMEEYHEPVSTPPPPLVPLHCFCVFYCTVRFRNDVQFVLVFARVCVCDVAANKISHCTCISVLVYMTTNSTWHSKTKYTIRQLLYYERTSICLLSFVNSSTESHVSNTLSCQMYFKTLQWSNSFLKAYFKNCNSHLVR